MVEISCYVCSIICSEDTSSIIVKCIFDLPWPKSLWKKEGCSQTEPNRSHRELINLDSSPHSESGQDSNHIHPVVVPVIDQGPDFIFWGDKTWKKKSNTVEWRSKGPASSSSGCCTETDSVIMEVCKCFATQQYWELNHITYNIHIYIYIQYILSIT